MDSWPNVCLHVSAHSLGWPNLVHHHSSYILVACTYGAVSWLPFGAFRGYDDEQTSEVAEYRYVQSMSLQSMTICGVKGRYIGRHNIG